MQYWITNDIDPKCILTCVCGGIIEIILTDIFFNSDNLENISGIFRHFLVKVWQYLVSFITHDVIFHRFRYGIRVYAWWTQLSIYKLILHHAGYKELPKVSAIQFAILSNRAGKQQSFPRHKKYGLSPQIRWPYGMKSRAPISLPLNLHCKPIAASFFIPYCHPIWRTLPWNVFQHQIMFL